MSHVAYDQSLLGLRPYFEGDIEKARAYYKEYLGFVKENIPPESRILDIGCGEGWSTLFLNEMGHQAVGLDVSQETPPACQFDKTLEYFSGDARSLPFEQGSFDVVVMYQTIAHIPDPLAVLQQCERVLKPQGHLVVVGPNLISFLFNLRCLFQAIKDRLRSEDPDPRRYPGGTTILERLGFTASFIFWTFKKLLGEKPVRFLMREPCNHEPFHGNNDASYLSNPMDLLNWARNEKTMKVQRWWKDGHRLIWPFTAGTWVVLKKTQNHNEKG